MERKIKIIERENGYGIKVVLITKSGTFVTDSKIVFSDWESAHKVVKNLDKSFKSTKVA